jgi:Mrp family chromosome partitioning ATPase
MPNDSQPAGPTAIGRLMSRLLARTGYDREQAASGLVDAWQQAVPEHLRAASQPGLVRRGVLEVVEKPDMDTTQVLEKFEVACNISLTTEVGLDLFNEVDAIADNLNSQVNFISTGWSWLDERIGGGFLQEGRAMYVFTGETNIGKSIFLGNVAINIAKQGRSVLLISLEMPEMI